MKAYLLSQADLDRLRAMVDRDPEHGYEGGSSQCDVNDGKNRMAYAEAHRFYNFQVCRWIDEVTKS